MVLKGKKGEFNYSFNASYFETDGPNFSYSELMGDTSLLQQYGISTTHSLKDMLRYTNRFANLSLNYNDFTLEFSHSDVDKYTFFVFPPYHTS